MEKYRKFSEVVPTGSAISQQKRLSRLRSLCYFSFDFLNEWFYSRDRNNHGAQMYEQLFIQMAGLF